MERKRLLGARIGEIRKKRGLSQDVLAERLGISTQYVSNIERGRGNPGLDLLFSMADTLNVELRDICDFEPEETNDKSVQNAIREILSEEKPERLKMVLRMLKAILR